MEEKKNRCRQHEDRDIGFACLIVLFWTRFFLSSFFSFLFYLVADNRAKKGNYHFELPFLDGHYYTKQIKKKITTSYFPRPFVSEIFCSMLLRSICYTQQKWANPKRSSRPTCCRIRFFAAGCVLVRAEINLWMRM